MSVCVCVCQLVEVRTPLVLMSYGLYLGWGDLEGTQQGFGGDLLRDIPQI